MATASDERHEAILSAALSVFLERGPTAASMAEIRERSGASIGSLYHRFGSKEGLAAALYVETLRGYQANFLAILQQHKHGRGAIESTVRAHLQWIEEHPDRARYLLLGRDADVRLTSQDELRALNRQFFSAVIELLRPMIDRAEIRDAPIDVLYALWLGPSQELARHWLTHGGGQPPSAHAGTLATAAWRSLNSGEQDSKNVPSQQTSERGL